MKRPDDSRAQAHVIRDQQTRDLLEEARDTSSPPQRQRLREKAAALNQGMALSIARRYHGRGVEDDDIDQVALFGLWKSVIGYSVQDDTPFAAYAVPTIAGEIKRHFRDHSWLVRPTRSVQENALLLSEARGWLRQRLGREPDDTDLADHLDLSLVDLRQARLARQAQRGQSLEAPIQGTTQCLEDVLPDPGESVERIDLGLDLRRAIGTLGPRDRQILRLRYGLGLTQTEIGDRLGISQMHVSRLLNRIHGALHDSLAYAS